MSKENLEATKNRCDRRKQTQNKHHIYFFKIIFSYLSALKNSNKGGSNEEDNGEDRKI